MSFQTERESMIQLPKRHAHQTSACYIKIHDAIDTLLAQQRIHSETCSGGLRQTFEHRQLFSDRTVAGVLLQLHHVVTFLKFPDSFRDSVPFEHLTL